MKKYICVLVTIACGFSACRKQDEFLDQKNNLNSVVPTRLSEFSALLDADALVQNYGYLGLIGTDHVNLNDADYNAVTIATERNGYVWAKEIFEGRISEEWSTMYRIISYANTCLEGLEKIPHTASNDLEWKRVQGSALFFRAWGLYNLLQFFAPPYNPATESTDMGVPIRLSSDVNIRPGRASVKDCYGQVIADLELAAVMLPISGASKTRPTLAAAQGLLAKTYLVTERWQLAEQFTGLALAGQSLIDFNTLNASASLPIPTLQNGNGEVVFYAEGSLSSYYLSNRPVFDAGVFQSYAANDLRRTVLFRVANNLPFFKGFYTGKSATPFAGIASNELYLIRAEAQARLGQKDQAMTTLNTLLVKRWKTGSYIPLSATDSDDALQKVLTERRKELPFHNSTVWEDLRRLNRDTRFARTLKRTVNGTAYTLNPNDARYTLPIPELEIRLTGIPQNIR